MSRNFDKDLSVRYQYTPPNTPYLNWSPLPNRGDGLTDRRDWPPTRNYYIRRGSGNISLRRSTTRLSRFSSPLPTPEMEERGGRNTDALVLPCQCHTAGIQRDLTQEPCFSPPTIASRYLMDDSNFYAISEPRRRTLLGGDEQEERRGRRIRRLRWGSRSGGDQKREGERREGPSYDQGNSVEDEDTHGSGIRSVAFPSDGTPMSCTLVNDFSSRGPWPLRPMNGGRF